MGAVDEAIRRMRGEILDYVYRCACGAIVLPEVVGTHVRNHRHRGDEQPLDLKRVQR